MADSYERFAGVYDELMDDVPYDLWAAFLREKLLERGIERGLICELGCGTGNMTQRLAEMGYDMIGIDASYDMLAVAREKQCAGQMADEETATQGECGAVSDILYLQQDMREFELYGTVRAVVSVCDCMNYILGEDELLDVFRLVNNYLDPGGIFIFDFNTVYKYKEVIGDTVIAESREDCSFIWENYYDEDRQMNEYDLTIFVQEEADLFRRFTETHLQRGYTLADMRRLIERAGMVFDSAFDMDTQGLPGEESGRICIIAVESGKQSSQTGG